MNFNKTILSFLASLCFISIATAQEKLQPPIPSGELLETYQTQTDNEEYKKALATIEQIQPGDTNYVLSLIKKTIALINLEKYDEAIEVCEFGMALEPKNKYQVFKLNKGFILSKQEKHQESLKEYKELEKEFPYYMAVKDNIAYQYLTIGC